VNTNLGSVLPLLTGKRTFLVDLIDGMATMLSSENDYVEKQVEYKEVEIEHRSSSNKLPLLGIGEKEDLEGDDVPLMNVLFVREQLDDARVVAAVPPESEGWKTRGVHQMNPRARFRNIEMMTRFVAGNATAEDKQALRMCDWSLVTDNADSARIANDIDDMALTIMLRSNGMDVDEHCVLRRYDLCVPQLDGSLQGIRNHLGLNQAMYFSASTHPQTSVLKSLREQTEGDVVVKGPFEALGLHRVMRSPKLALTGTRAGFSTLFMGDDLRNEIKMPLVIGSGKYDGFVAQMPLGVPAVGFQDLKVPSLAHLMIADRSEHANINTSLPCTEQELEREFLMLEFAKYAWRLYAENRPIGEAGDEVVAKAVSLTLPPDVPAFGPDTPIQTYVLHMVAGMSEEVRKGRPGYKIYIPGEYDTDVMEVTAGNYKLRLELVARILHECFRDDRVPMVFYQPPEFISMTDKHWHLVPVPAAAMDHTFGRTKFPSGAVTTTGTYVPVETALLAKSKVPAIAMH
jgi:hypothetical protein